MAKNNDPLFVDPILLQQAERLCKSRLEGDPENRAALRSLAEVYRKLGDLGEAAAAYKLLSRLDPQDQEAGYLQAVFGGKEWPVTPKGVRAAPFVLVKDFLPADFHDALLPLFISIQDKFAPVPAANRQYDPDVRQTLEFLDEWEGKERFLALLVGAVRRAIPRLHLPPFKIGVYEILVRVYQDGHFFRIHWDADPNSRYANRMINFVYYFHKTPRPFSGGELLLFDTDVEANKLTRSRFTRVVPEDNSVIFFPPNFYHCVVPIRCPSEEFADSRFTINGHVRKRPEAKRAVDGPVENHGGMAVP